VLLPIISIDKYGLNYDPETQIVATTGVTEGVFSAFNAILQAGDEVLIPSPSFTIYGPDADFNGAAPVYLDTSKTGFKVTPEALAEVFRTNPRIKIFLLNYPSNPTGVSYTEDELQALADVLKQHDVFVISDEIYSELTYSFKHVSFGNILPEQTILLNGLSKSHAMTGWRFGVVCGPAEVISQINKIHELATTSITSITQYAALEAYTNGYNDPAVMKEQYQVRRDALYEGLKDWALNVQLQTELSTYLQKFLKITSKTTLNLLMNYWMKNIWQFYQVVSLVSVEKDICVLVMLPAWKASTHVLKKSTVS
jgi:Aspartate/tyrosine/aromatic aminotransferase